MLGGFIQGNVSEAQVIELVKLLKADMGMLGSQHRSLVPAVNMTVLKLLDFAQLSKVAEKGEKLLRKIQKCVRKYFQMSNKKMPHVQVITSAVQSKLAAFEDDGFTKLGKRQLS